MNVLDEQPQQNLENLNTYKVLGVKVNVGLTYSDVITLIRDKFIPDKKSHIIVTLNPEMIMAAQQDEEYKDIINAASLSVPDGTGVIMAIDFLSKVKSFKSNLERIFRGLFYGIKTGLRSVLDGSFLSKRITGVTLTEEIMKLADERRYSVFLLGGHPRNFRGANKKVSIDLANETVCILKSKYPNVHFIGSSSQFTAYSSDDNLSYDLISSCMLKHGIERLDLLLVAYNPVYQEKFISRIIKRLPISVSIGIGGTFDYIVGTSHYSPELLRNIGLEWLYRLITQPWRFKRIFNAFPRFPFKIYVSSIRNNN